MNSVSNGSSLDKAPRRPSLVARMAIKTKSKVRNFKSYKTISLLPRLFRPDSNSWARFDLDTTEFASLPEQETNQNKTLNVPRSTTSNETSSQQKPTTHNSRDKNTFLKSKLFSSPDYEKDKNKFNIKSSSSGSSIGSVDQSRSRYVDRNDFIIEMGETTFPERTCRIKSEGVSSSEDGFCKKGQKEDGNVDFIWEECKNEMSRTWHNFTSETTAHGYKRTMATHRGLVGRLVWGVIILGVSSIAMALVYQTVIQQDLNTVSSIMKSQPYTKMAFPAVTICNLASYDFSRVNETTSSQQNKDNQFLQQVLQLHNFQIIPSENETLELFRNFSTQHLHDLIGWKLQNFIRKCQWNEIDINCSEKFVQVKTVNEGCFTFNFDPDNQTLADRAGSYSGLGIIIHVDKFKEGLQLEIPSGIKVLLHEPTEFPDVLEQGMLVSSGTTTYMSITKNEYKFLAKPFKAYGTFYCVDTPKTSNMQFYNYTGDAACIAECRLNRVIRACGCVVYGRDPEILGIPYCSMVNYTTCYMPTLRTLLDFENCNCQLPCHKVEYSSQMSSALFGRTAHSLKFLISSSTNSSEEEAASPSEFVELKIFYKELFTHIEEHIAVYTWLTIFGNVGGQMGLFMGASVLTMLEFVELFSVFVWLALVVTYRRLKTKWRSDTQQLGRTAKLATEIINGKWRPNVEQL